MGTGTDAAAHARRTGQQTIQRARRGGRLLLRTCLVERVSGPLAREWTC